MLTGYIAVNGDGVQTVQQPVIGGGVRPPKPPKREAGAMDSLTEESSSTPKRLRPESVSIIVFSARLRV